MAMGGVAARPLTPPRTAFLEGQCVSGVRVRCGSFSAERLRSHMRYGLWALHLSLGGGIRLYVISYTVRLYDLRYDV
jgi:hypothetical protein